MNIYTYIVIYVYIFLCMCVCEYFCVLNCGCLYLHKYTRKRTHAKTFVCAHLFTRKCIYTHTHTRPHIHTHTHLYTNAHTHIHAHTHTIVCLYEPKSTRTHTHARTLKHTITSGHAPTAIGPQRSRAFVAVSVFARVYRAPEYVEIKCLRCERARVGEWVGKKEMDRRQRNTIRRRERECKKCTDGPIAGDACHV